MAGNGELTSFEAAYQAKLAESPRQPVETPTAVLESFEDPLLREIYEIVACIHRSLHPGDLPENEGS